MKRILWYVLILAAALLIPQKGMDVGKLLPVELVYLDRQEQYTIETDTGDVGRGKSLKEAFDDLEKTAKGVIYLDTADYLLVSEAAEAELNGMKAYLKPKTQICLSAEKVDLAEAALFLAVHNPGATLGEHSEEMPELYTEKGGLKLKNAY